MINPEKVAEALLQNDLKQAESMRKEQGGILAPPKYQRKYEQADRERTAFREGSRAHVILRLEQEAANTQDSARRREYLASRNFFAREVGTRKGQPLYRLYPLLLPTVVSLILGMGAVYGLYWLAQNLSAPNWLVFVFSSTIVICGVVVLISIVNLPSPREVREMHDWSFGLTELDHLASAEAALKEGNYEDLALLKEGRVVTASDLEGLNQRSRDDDPDWYDDKGERDLDREVPEI